MTLARRAVRAATRDARHAATEAASAARLLAAAPVSVAAHRAYMNGRFFRGFELDARAAQIAGVRLSNLPDGPADYSNRIARCLADASTQDLLDELVHRDELTHQVQEVVSVDRSFHRRNDVYTRSTWTDITGEDGYQ